MNEIIVSTAEAAKRLGLTVGTLQKMRMRPRNPIPFIRLSPRKIGYAVTVLDEFVRQRQFTCTREYADTAA
jgi:hypothetical protein